MERAENEKDTSGAYKQFFLFLDEQAIRLLYNYQLRTDGLFTWKVDQSCLKQTLASENRKQCYALSSTNLVNQTK